MLSRSRCCRATGAAVAAVVGLLLLTAAGCGGTADSAGRTDALGDVSFVGRDAGAADGVPDAAAADDTLTPVDVPGVPDVPLAPDVPAGPDVPAEPDAGAPPPLVDQDGDGVPDIADRWPIDADWPGVARASSVYAHTSTELYRMDVKSFVIERVRPFGWPEGVDGTRQMTDIAIDRYGVLYAISFDNLHICHPETAVCVWLGALPEQFNGMTLVPGPVFGSATDVLVGISNDGGWYRLDTAPGAGVRATWLGDYGGYCSSGDAFSAEGVGTFATAKRGTSCGATFGDDILVELDPRTGRVLREVVTLTGLGSVWGLAGWRDQVYAYDESGAVAFVDLDDVIVRTVHADSGYAWWGAGTRTLFPEE